MSVFRFHGDLPRRLPQITRAPTCPRTRPKDVRSSALASKLRRERRVKMSGEGGLAHLAPQAAVLASPSGSAQTARCSTIQRDCLADARALPGSESPRTVPRLAGGFGRGRLTERGVRAPGPLARHSGVEANFHPRTTTPTGGPMNELTVGGRACQLSYTYQMLRRLNSTEQPGGALSRGDCMPRSVWSSLTHHFSTVAARYNELRTTDPEPIELIARSLGQLPSVTAANVGCGTGRYTMELGQRLGKRLFVYFIDRSKGMLERLRLDPNLSAFGGFDVLRSRAEILPLPDATLDCMLTFHAIHHFDVTKFLQEAARTLRSGGL